MVERAAPTAVALAQLRASGAVPRPAGGQFAAWSEAAARAGRRLTDVSRPGAPGLVALGWVDGAEPVAGPGTGVERAFPTPVTALPFAAVLQACWADRAEHPYPGGLVRESQVLAALRTLRPIRGTGEAEAGPMWQYKGALVRLADSGLIERDGSWLRLGPRVGLWSDAQVSALRVIYDQLPVAPDRPDDEPATLVDPGAGPADAGVDW